MSVRRLLSALHIPWSTEGMVRLLFPLCRGLILISQSTYAQTPQAVSAADRHHAFVKHVEERWRGPRYDLSFEITPVDSAEGSATILRSSGFAISVTRVAELMSAVGFQRVHRVDNRFFQPVLVGTRPA